MLLKVFSQSRYNNWVGDIVFLLIFLGGLTFFLLGARPLFVPDEGRYAEIAREMVASHNFITPYLNEIKYFEKPILFYWLSAAAIKLGGLNLWSIRSINGILSVIGILATYFTARKLFDRKTGLLAAVILGTNLLYFIMSRMISLDLPVTIFLSLSLYAFLLALNENKIKNSYLFFSSIMAACAVLTKGLIGIVFPLMIIFSWFTLLNKWKLLKQLPLLSCIIIFVIFAAPWHILVSIKNPEFPYFYFIEQHFLRYSTLYVGHYQPFWFFIPCLIIGLFPWIVFLPQTICAFFKIRQRQLYAKELFLLIWAIGIFAFFSFSKSKLIPYILPIFPPLSILIARYLIIEFTQKNRLGIGLAYFTLFFLNLGIACGFYLYLNQPLFFQAHNLLIFAISILILSTIAACFYIYQASFKSIFITVFSMWIFLLSFTIAMPILDNRTILPLAKTLKPILRSSDEVITYNQYYQDLPFYLERRVNILNWRNELTYGMKYQTDNSWMLNDRDFWKLWTSKKRVFVLISNDELQNLQKNYPEKKFYLWNKTVNTTLISNRPLLT